MGGPVKLFKGLGTDVAFYFISIFMDIIMILIIIKLICGKKSNKNKNMWHYRRVEKRGKIKVI